MAIQTLITSSGLTRKQVADRMDVSMATVSRWATGQIKVPNERMAALSALLGTTADAIVRATPANRTQPKHRALSAAQDAA